MSRKVDNAIARLKASVALTHSLEGCADSGDLIWLDIVSDEGGYLGAFIGAGFDEIRQIMIAAEVLDAFPKSGEGFQVLVYQVPPTALVPYQQIMRKLEPGEAVMLRRTIYGDITICPTSTSIH